jgi:xylose dehydrogenase (NAD/NADP)
MQNEIVSHVNPVRWGVIGLANVAVKRVIPALLASESESLIAIASRNPQRAVELFAHLSDLRIYDGYQRLLDDPEVEAVYIPLPNSLHREWTESMCSAKNHWQ